MSKPWERPGELKDILSIISIAVVALLLIILFKLKGGILGIVVGTIAVVTLIYWLREIRKIFKEEKPYYPGEAEWFFDLLNEEEGVTFIARVPGPAEEVKVKLINNVLEIKGSGDFMRKVEVPEGTRLQNKSYINGVLHVRLQRVKTPDNRMPYR